MLCQSVALEIDDPSKVGAARRAAVALADRQEFDETSRGQLAIAVTEAATNILKHATSGLLFLREVENGQGGGIDVLALDRGPGIRDVRGSLVDGFSTAGSSGHGLGAISRLSSVFGIHSQPQIGTAVFARFLSKAEAASGVNAGPPPISYGVVALPAPGEDVCGDSWAVEGDADRTWVMVVDGLGHGEPASVAAREAVRVFRQAYAHGPAATLKQAHEILRSTRGAAMAIAEIDRTRREVRFAGVGNIAAVILVPPEMRGSNLVSHNGTVGHILRKVQEFTYPWPEGAILVMHSDGLESHWRLDRYTGLSGLHPSLLAGILVRDFKRGRDDATALVAREGSATPS